MSDEQKHQDPHQAEKEDASAQLSAIDLINQGTAFVRTLPFGGAVPRVFGKTDFEGHDLNAMIDLVESAKPEDLETAGKALWDAKDAIETAANELKDHIGRVEWEGESATAFHTWGGNLVKHALELATFAEAAGTQITAAATGLASVRSAMPPRDTRLVRTPVEDIPTPKQVDGNEEYTAAVKVEKDRQEAINQMNRLASFYEVSEGYLAKQEAPTFEAMPDVGVPKPDASYRDPIKGSEVQGGAGLGAARESLATGNDNSGTGTKHPRSEGTTPPLRHVDDPTIRPDGNVGTNIDSVGTLPPQETMRPAPNVPTGPGPSGGNGGTVPPFPSGTVPPGPGGLTGRTSGFGGANGNRAPISAQGRTATPNGTAGGRGTPGPMGRATAAGQSGIRGGGASPMGRGVSGGTPRPIAGPASGRAGGASSGAARGNGVVGGRPTTGATPASTGSRVSRGTVVGAEGNTASRTPAGKIGQRGVIGAPNSTPAGARTGQTARPAGGNPDGVVGTPQGRAPAARSGGAAGGSAQAPRSLRGNRRNANDEDREGERQPDPQRRNAPPVTD
ncbi:WXG100 family type VII secretion target [Streptomyces sp. V4I2]|uniref:WXG100 family type VII secretion target n=1 Tax=Streptomyces sp. V4I2 TaxID=3042280 RepID=UPI00277EE0BB|nr:WXG100 family type VII secretion target [Streptomyces sp. V4I2]MDQ1048999.1 uncharacterized protein YukE [Streptomyces sp. V4I2]